MNSSTVYSKLDFRLGFHQTELDEHSRSRDITTHDGLFRYKRLMFGVSCIREIYQQMVRQALAGTDSCQNIADDLAAHGKDQETHDWNLENVVRRLERRNFTCAHLE